MRTLLPLLLLTLAACGHDRAAVRAEPFRAAEVIEIPVPTYVPVDSALLARCPWTRGVQPSQAMAAARRRGECAEQYERQFDAIERLQGKPAPSREGAP